MRFSHLLTSPAVLLWSLLVTDTMAATASVENTMIVNKLSLSLSTIADLRGGASHLKQRQPAGSTTPRGILPVQPTAHGGPSLQQTSSSSTTTVQSTANASILHAVTFLFVFAFATTSLAPAPALISSLGAEQATTLLSILTGSGALLEILFSAEIGSILDSMGRKPAMVLNMVLASCVNAAVAMQGSVPALCLAKFYSSLALAVGTLALQAAMSDMSQTVENPQKWLSSTLGLNMALSGLGFLLGIVAAGMLSEKGGLQVTFGVSAALSAMAGICTLVFLPETLPVHKRTLVSNKGGTQRLRQLLMAPLSSTSLLFRHGAEVRVLAILLMLLSMPGFQGDMFQVFSRQEWGLDTKSFSNYLALYVTVGIFANGCGSFLIRRIGTKNFTLLAIASRMISGVGAAFFGYKGAVVGVILGFLGSAQSIGIIAALVSAGARSGFPQGELAGERSSLMALLKVVGPLLYSFLYLKGSTVLGMPNLPLVFNVVLSVIAFMATQTYLQ